MTEPMKLKSVKAPNNNRTNLAKPDKTHTKITERFKAEFIQNRVKSKNITIPIETKP